MPRNCFSFLNLFGAPRILFLLVALTHVQFSVIGVSDSQRLISGKAGNSEKLREDASPHLSCVSMEARHYGLPMTSILNRAVLNNKHHQQRDISFVKEIVMIELVTFFLHFICVY